MVPEFKSLSMKRLRPQITSPCLWVVTRIIGRPTKLLRNCIHVPSKSGVSGMELVDCLAFSLRLWPSVRGSVSSMDVSLLRTVHVGVVEPFATGQRIF